MPPSIVNGTCDKFKIADLLTVANIVKAIVVGALAVATAWTTTQGEIRSVKRDIQEIREHGSKAFIDEKEKYYQQFLEIQKSLIRLETSANNQQRQLDEIKADVKAMRR